MNIVFRTVGFSVLLVLLFASVTYVLPQMEGPAPEETEVDVGSLTMESFVALGEDLFQGKGTCTLCHNQLGRAPDLLAFDVVQMAGSRLVDGRYAGTASSAEEYLRESLLTPSAYVVEGFGQKGSNDTVSPMPAVQEPPLQLSDLEVDAIVAYMQRKDGHQVTVELPQEGAPEQAPTQAAAQTAAQSPEAALAKYTCTVCHAVLGSQAAIGPELRTVAARRSPDEIREAIVSPRAVITEGYPPVMPEFPDMTLRELEMIVGFLSEPADQQ